MIESVLYMEDLAIFRVKVGDVIDRMHAERSLSYLDESRQIYDSILTYEFGIYDKSCGAYFITCHRAPGRILSTIADYVLRYFIILFIEPTITSQSLPSCSPLYHSQAFCTRSNPLQG